MRSLQEREMTFKDFERACEELVARCFPDHKVCPQKTVTFANGKTRRIDIYVAERKRGGKRYVIDCKHYTKTPLTKDAVDWLLEEYKNPHKASAAILLISGSTQKAPGLDAYAKSKGVPIIRIREVNSELVNQIQHYFVKKELRRTVS